MWSDPVAAEWGYPELIYDVHHGPRLADHEPDTLDIFTARYLAAEREDRADDE